MKRSRSHSMQDPTRAAGPLALCVAVLVAAAGCGNGGGDDDRPSSVEDTSPTSDTVEVGATLEPPLEVRVTNGRGEPLAGVSVRFDVVIGPGQVSPARTTTGTRGRAEATYGGGERVGIARIEADLPDAPDAGKAVFTVRVVSPTSTRISAVAGGGQEAEAGSQLPRPFRVEVRTPGGSPAGGVPVAWTVREGPGTGAPGGRLLVDTTFTDGSGRSENLLTLGEAAGEYRVSAWSRGAPDTAAFVATAVDSLTGGVALDSVVPRPMVAGQVATLHGSGFPSTPSAAGARVEGAAAEVLAAAPDSLRIRVPEFTDRCLPARDVGVRAESDGTPSNGLTVRLDPAGGFLDLAVGERTGVSPPGETACLQLDSAATGRAYRVMAQSASRVSGSVTPARLVARSGSTVGAALAEPAALRLEPADLPSWVMGPADRGLVLRTRLQQRAREAVLSQPPRGEGPPAARTTPPVAARPIPEEGDTLRLFMPVGSDLSISCTDTSDVVTAVVRAAGDRVALLEDTASPPGGLDGADYGSLLREMDEEVFPVDTSYFGPPSDVDGNERILVLLTPEVNALTPPGSEAFVGGFFLATDLVDSGDSEGSGVRGPGGEICPSSNEGEIVYLATADPTGRFGIEVSRQRSLRNARSVSAHEIEHLLSAAQRMVFGGGWITDLESAWLGEGLAHVAEEVAGFGVQGLRTRDELTHGEITADPEVFEAYFFNNFARAGLFMQRPAETLTIIARDPGGLESLRMRGFGWLFMRWLGDHFGPDGSGGPVGGSREEALFRALSSGGAGHAQGIDNVLRSVQEVSGSSASWEELLADFGAMLPVEDDVSGLPARLTLPTWRLRDVFRGIHEGGRGGQEPFTEAYPLQIEESAFVTSAWDFDVNASGQLYFEFGSQGASAPFSLSLESQSGGALPPGARAHFTIVRVR